VEDRSVRTFRVFLPLALALLSSLLHADQVVLKNGDRLTGTIEKSDDKSLVIRTEFAGEVTMQWGAVQEVKSEQPLHVGLKDGRMVVGAISTSGTNVDVATKGGEAVEVPKESIVAMRSDAEQLAWEKLQHPGLLRGWNGGVNLGFGLTGGNSETKNLALGFNAVRTGLHDKLTLYAASVYSTNDLAPSATRVTANTNRGGARYDRDITPRLFAFVNTDFFTDALQDLNLRSVFGGGLGAHVIKHPSTTLDILGGIAYTRENYTQVAPLPRLIHSFAAGQLGDEFLRKLGKSTVITQRAYFFPDFNSAGEYRATFDLGTVTKLNKWLGWQNSLGDVYVTNPPTGKKKNDVVFTTGLNVTFTH
jgi:putative salt-induced outer membrane protein YdiY